MISNPVLPGFNPDPSIVLVDGVYYLVTSTFEYLPGLPVHRSTDLVSWEHIGNVATRPEQLDLGSVPTPGGAWAPTIRHRDGVFYVIVTVMLGGRGCVVFTTTDPAGPWDDGTAIPAVTGIDPDLAWDDDGTALVTFAGFPHPIRQVRVDLATGRALEEVRTLWEGTGRYAPEGPHLYRRGEHWYLLVAEGGTDRGHAVSIARGPSPEGPWESAPDNPVVTATGTENPVQNLGHADLVETPDGGTAMVMLGVRPVGFGLAFSPLGRETFLSPVRWVEGWPRAELVTPAPTPDEDVTMDLAGPAVLTDPGWLSVRRTPTHVAAVDGAGLVLTGDGRDLDDVVPCFLGRRQRHMSATVSVRVDASTGRGGLAARHDETHWFALEARGDGTVTRVTARAALAGIEQTWAVDLAPGAVELRMDLLRPPSGFVPAAAGGGTVILSAVSNGQHVRLAEFDGRYWSFEVAKSFTGRVLGLYAVDGRVRFTELRYRGTDAMPD
ncbi:glycoside hydrolase [Terrabacter sp. 28]|nr:glycoside hydrolase [Terrabacter sp. 28]